jgi:hypothetical protein
VFAAVLPRRLWPRFQAYVPVSSSAVIVSGIGGIFAGAFLALTGLLAYAGHAADVHNTLILTRPIADAERLAYARPAASFLWYFEFMLLTPQGLWSLYLLITGFVRAASGAFDDPRGDPLLSAVDWAIASGRRRVRLRRAARVRQTREGEEAPDVLITGEAAGLQADYVVLASRRKPEWTAGATILTGDAWYRLGNPIEMELPYGLRTLYPLTKLEAIEVLRRGIEYELPHLSKRRLR